MHTQTLLSISLESKGKNLSQANDLPTNADMSRGFVPILHEIRFNCKNASGESGRNNDQELLNVAMFRNRQKDGYTLPCLSRNRSDDWE